MNYFDVLFGMKLEAKKHPAVIKKRTGNPIEFEDGADAPLVKCTTAIQGNQDLHGYDKPWVGGAGKNKLPMTVSGIKGVNTGTWSGNSLTVSGVTFTILTDSDGNVTGIKATGTASANVDLVLVGLTTLTEGNIINGSTGGSSSTYGIGLFQIGIVTGDGDYSISSSAASSDRSIYIRIMSGYAIPTGGITFYPMIRVSGASATFAPYSNICPITAYDEGSVTVSDDDTDPTTSTTHTATFSNSIYQGNADFVGGEGRVEWVTKDLGDCTWSYDSSVNSMTTIIDGIKYPATEQTLPDMILSICQAIKSNDRTTTQGIRAYIFSPPNTEKRLFIRDSGYTDPTAFKTDMTGQQIAYELATPTTETITPTNLPIKSLFGYNHIESSTGEMEIEYIAENYQEFVDVIEETFGNGTRKGGRKAIDVFRLLDPEREPEPKKEDEPEKEPEKEVKK
jgi:hypothetical protein